MSEAHAHAHDHVEEILGQAVWAFAALGLVQLLVAFVAHKVALGTDGGHNLLEFLILGISRWGHINETADEVNFWNCRVVPRTAEVTSIGTIVAAGVFLALSWGNETRQGCWLALGLVAASTAVNAFYALSLHDHRDDGDNAHASWSHLVGDTIASALAVVAYLAIGLGYSLAIDPIMAVIGVVVIVVVHIRPIRRGRRTARYHRIPGHTHEPDHSPK